MPSMNLFLIQFKCQGLIAVMLTPKLNLKGTTNFFPSFVYITFEKRKI